jgi:hypothetical protein
MKFILHNYLIEEEFRSQNQLVGDSDPSPIEDHQIFGGSLNSSTSRTEFNSEFWLLTPEFFLINGFSFIQQTLNSKIVLC